MTRLFILFALGFSAATAPALAHPEPGEATYLANEAVMVVSGDQKLLFDPFYAETFDIYRQVPEPIRSDMLAGNGVFQGVDAIVVSHAHADHFAADVMRAYMTDHPEVRLYAPGQAVAMMDALGDIPDAIRERITEINLEYGDDPIRIDEGGLTLEVVRIPHAGWPAEERAVVQNYVFRVSAGKDTVMHMGDADPRMLHFAPYEDHWKARRTDLAMPPYWFYFDKTGREILDEVINAEDSVGVHVPVEVPRELIRTGRDFFQTPGETRSLSHDHD